MLKDIINFFKKEYKTLNRIEILQKNLLDNHKYLTSLDRGLKVVPVVKSNGYGHGIVEIAKILDEAGFAKRIPFLCVDSLFEAYELLKAGIELPILIMGFTEPENLKVKKLPFSFAVYNLELAKALDESQPGCKIHIFVDTGMGREGILVNQLSQFLKELKKCKNLKIEGLMSHLASSEGKNDKAFLNQIANFKKAQLIVKRAGIKPRWVHIAASGSITNPEIRNIIARVSNMVRAGLSLYGYSPTISDTRLKPALRLITNITQIKTIKKGEKIGYDGTYTAKKDMVIGILPIGYYDGVDRGLSNKGIVTMNNFTCPIIGRVSMNITTIDLTHISEPQIGQEVIVYSENISNKNSIENVAKICKKLPYEILVNLASSTKRMVV